MKTYGERKPSYVVQTKGDRLHVCVKHSNKEARTLIADRSSDPQQLLVRREAFARDNRRAFEYLAEIMQDYEDFFTSGQVDFDLDEL